MSEEKPEDPPAAAAQEATEDKEDEDSSPPTIDLTHHDIKPDMFEGIHVLDEKFEKIEGAPNFRHLKGFPVFGTGQPTEAAMVEIINKAKEGVGKDNAKVYWFTMRQEPIVYVNGFPYAPRDPENRHVNLDIKMNSEEIRRTERHLAKVLKARQVASGDDTLKIRKDEAFVENPMERKDYEDTIKAESIKDHDAVYSFCQSKCEVDLQVIRIPLQEDQMPTEYIDTIVDALKNEPASTPCIFSCQMGKGRTTLGMAAACLVKEITLTAELRKMTDANLIPESTYKDLIYSKFEKIDCVPNEEEDPYTAGNYDVIKQLCNTSQDAVEAKKKIDIIIDKCGPPPKGIGIQNLRECIIQTKWKYDVAAEDKQVAYKEMIVNFIQRYFYMICFGQYALQNGFMGYPESFASWLKNSKDDLHAMIENGKDKLEWSRSVDATKLDQLRQMMSDPNYKQNLPSLIRTIYQFAFQTYSDLPRGPIKNNSMKKLCASTLSEIIPPEINEMINKKLEEDPSVSSHDFLTLVGMLSYF